MTRASDLRAYAAQLRAEASDPDLCDADVRDLTMRADECERVRVIEMHAMREMRG